MNLLHEPYRRGAAAGWRATQDVPLLYPKTPLASEVHTNGAPLLRITAMSWFGLWPFFYPHYIHLTSFSLSFFQEIRMI